MEIIFISLIIQLILFQLSAFLPLAVKSVLYLLNPDLSDIFINNACELISMIAYVAVFCIPAYIMGKHASEKKECKKSCFSYKIYIPEKAPQITFSVLGGVTFIGFFNFIFKILLETSGFGIQQSAINVPDDILGTVLVFISLVLVPAIVEEILFRGVLLHLLLPYGKAFAIFFSSAAFAIMHCHPLQFIYAFFGGVIFSYAAIKSGSIFYCTVLHFTNNLISFAALLINKYAPQKLATILISSIDLFLISVGIVCFVYLIKKGFFVIEEKKNKTFSPYKNMLSIYTVIYILYALYLTSRWFYIV